MWLQRWLGNNYLRGWSRLYSNPFTVNELAFTLRVKVNVARVALSRLKREYAVIEFDKRGKQTVYRFVDPEVFFLINSGSLMGFDRACRKTFHLVFKVASKLWFTEWASGLIICADARPGGVNRLEFLVLCREGLSEKLVERLSYLIKLERIIRQEIEFLARCGLWIKIRWLPLTLSEVERVSNKSLSEVKKGIILFDKNGDAFKALNLIKMKIMLK